MVHAQLEHREVRSRAAAAPRSAARPNDCCSSSPNGASPARRQAQRQRFLGRSLADRAGDGDALGAPALARRFAQFARPLRAHPAPAAPGPSPRLSLVGDQRGARPRYERFGEKIVAVRASFSATNRSPGSSVRVSMETPPAPQFSPLSKRPPVARWASWALQSSAIMHPPHSLRHPGRRRAARRARTQWPTRNSKIPRVPGAALRVSGMTEVFCAIID